MDNQTLPISNVIANPTSVDKSVLNQYWNKKIRKFNMQSAGIAVGLLLTIDLAIAYGSGTGSFSLWPLWWEMVGVIGINFLFILLEEYYGEKFKYSTENKYDKNIYDLVKIRGVLVVLNCIPVLQVLIMLIGIFLAPIILLVELVLIEIKSRNL